MCLHLGLVLKAWMSLRGDLAHKNLAPNKQTDEQRKMEEWGLKDGDG